MQTSAIASLQFRTRRLVISPLISSAGDLRWDEPALLEIAGILTPAVLEHLPEPLRLPDVTDPVTGWLAARLAESFLFEVTETVTNVVIGLLILADTSEIDARPTLRLGYLFGQSKWGKGYATELVAGLIKEIGEKGWSGHVMAGVSIANPGSSRALLKAGFVEVPAMDAGSRTFQVELS